MKVFWFLSIYSFRPDGSTVMIRQHHKQLLKNGVQSYIVNSIHGDQIEWLPQLKPIKIYDAARMIQKDDLLFTSWDDMLQMILGFNNGKKVAYLQSHFANRQQSYQAPCKLVTVSNFAKDFINKTYNRQCLVLPNVVKTLQPIRFNKKKQQICIARPRRDQDVLMKFLQRSRLPIVGGQFYFRKQFLKLMNQSKYFLSYFREDAFGLPSIEAMSMGTIPIIISNSTGKDYIQPGVNGFYMLPPFVNAWDDQFLKKWNLQDISNKAIQTSKRYKDSKIIQLLEVL